MPSTSEPVKRTMGQVLSENPPLSVPVWQRPYSWETEQIADYWSDISSFSDGRAAGDEYFLGTVITVPQNEPRTREVLDGQRRLATSMILLASIRDALSEYESGQAAAGRLQDSMIQVVDDVTGTRSPRLTLSQDDRDFFQRHIVESEALPPTLRGRRGSHKNIIRAKQFFDGKVTGARPGRNEEQHRQWCLNLLGAVRDGLALIVIATTDRDDATSVFETLNDRGIGLTTSELVRMYLLQEAQQQDIAQIVSYWSDIFALEARPGFRNFLRHFWVSRRGDVKARALSKTVRAYVRSDEFQGSLEFTRDVSDASKIYASLLTADVADRRLKALLTDVGALGANVLLPALLRAIEVNGNATNPHFARVADFVGTLISAYFRYIVIGGRESTLLEAQVFAMAPRFATLGADAIPGIIADLKTFAPTDEVFRSEFATQVLERGPVQQYVLRKLEEQRRGNRGEMVVADAMTVHVEHIYPQNPDQRWTNHDEVINRIGNLTLLHGTPNRENQNHLYPAKRESYRTSEVLLTRDIAEQYDDWTAGDIDARQGRLAEVAPAIWAL